MQKVSIIIPTYNSSSYLSGAVDSVLSQTYKNNEVIVVDDGSTDRTKQLIQERYPEVLYVYQDNHGPSVARNHGIGMATGDYIAFLDSDDLWFPKKLELQMEVFRKDASIGLVSCDALSFMDNKIVVPSLAKERPLHSGWVLKYLLRQNFLNTNNVLIKREVLDSVGLFDEAREFSEDYDLWVRIAKRHKIGYVDAVLTKYRIHNMSRSNINRNTVYEAHSELVMRHFDADLGLFEKNDILSFMHFMHGYNLFNDSNPMMAKKYFIRSILRNPINIKPYVYLAGTFLPSQMVRSIKKVKQNQQLT